MGSGEDRSAALRWRWRELGRHLGVTEPGGSDPASTPSNGEDARWADVRDALIAAYGADGRAYHGVGHLAAVLDLLDELWPHPDRPVPPAVRAAAWFHDAVYEPRPPEGRVEGSAGDRATDEARSADWARRALGAAGVADAEVAARLVEATAGHRLVGDLATVPGAACFLDADLAVLGADPATYDRYVAGVREEYAHLDDDAFDRGRLAVLVDLAARPHLYLTGRGRARFDAAARSNLRREIAVRERAVGEAVRRAVSGGAAADRPSGGA